MKKRYYSELLQLSTIEERFEYLKLSGEVGEATFGGLRELNQEFYTSKAWKDIRRQVIIRDNGCDLGVDGFEIKSSIYVHHMNPVTIEDILEERWDKLLNPENLICTSFGTHEAIHYGDKRGLPKLPIERRPGDTCPWR